MATFWTSRGVKWIGGGWSFFILENLVLSENREEIIGAFGDDKYHMAYNTLSTMACSSIMYGYIRHAKKDPIPGLRIPKRGNLAIALGFSLHALGLAGLSQLLPKLQVPVGLAPVTGPVPERTAGPIAPQPQPVARSLKVRCPMDFKPVDVPEDGIYGLSRISRHATFWSFGIASLGTAVTSIYMPEIVMFTFPLVFAYIGTTHQDMRHRRGSGGELTKEYEEKTSNIPFVALLGGRQSWEELGNEIKWTNVGLSSLAALGFALRKIR